MAQEADKKLFVILDECAFQPVLNSSEGEIAESKRYKLPQLKERLSLQRERFHNCISDEELYQTYHEELVNDETDEIIRDLRELNLPAITDCEEQLERAAAHLFDKSARKQDRSGLDRS